ncbi:MAG: hypothetical protein QXU82_01155 [Candidatus Aenigmatarchaeota archaeon]
MAEEKTEQKAPEAQEKKEMTEETAYKELTENDEFYDSLGPKERETYEGLIRKFSALNIYNFLSKFVNEDKANEKTDAFLRYVRKSNIDLKDMADLESEYTGLSDAYDVFGEKAFKEEKFSYLYEPDEEPKPAEPEEPAPEEKEDAVDWGEEAVEEDIEEMEEEAEEELPGVPKMYDLKNKNGETIMSFDLNAIENGKTEAADGFTYVLVSAEALKLALEGRKDMKVSPVLETDELDQIRTIRTCLDDYISKIYKTEELKAWSKVLDTKNLWKKEAMLLSEMLEDVKEDEFEKHAELGAIKSAMNKLKAVEGSPKLKYICAHGGKVTITLEDMAKDLEGMAESGDYGKFVDAINGSIAFATEQAKNIMTIKPFLWGNESAAQEASHVGKELRHIQNNEAKLIEDKIPAKLYKQVKDYAHRRIVEEIMKDDASMQAFEERVIDALHDKLNAKHEKTAAYVIKLDKLEPKFKKGKVYAIGENGGKENVDLIDITKTMDHEQKKSIKEAAYCIADVFHSLEKKKPNEEAEKAE